MNADRWKQITRIYGAVVASAPHERAAAMAAMCGDDPALRQEVESLLDESEERPMVLDTPPWDVVGGHDEAERHLAAGTTLGLYRVVSLLGAGGMGEVYRARDSRLNRDVALKVLPATVADDPDRLARFTREAQVLASLNHPNIGAIYGLEEGQVGRVGPVGQAGQAGRPLRFLVMELVEGDDLSRRIASGAMPLDEALPIARQIAEALEAAHEQGIIHRDLKPANIKVRPDGTVKVLDFGLAKIVEAGGAGGAGRGGGAGQTGWPDRTDRAGTTLGPGRAISDGPTAANRPEPDHATLPGMILGTAAYMSPEQARGKPADKRSDVWAFGCVLYETLSGRRAFDGDDVAETLAAVLRQDVDWTALPASTPTQVRDLIGRCLERDIKRRLRDVGEARILLEDPTATVVGGLGRMAILAPAKPRWRRALSVVLAAIVVSLLASAATVYLTPSQAPPVTTRFTFTLSDGQAFGTTTTRSLIAISPDGTHIAYAANGRLFLRLMSELEARPIASGPPGSSVMNPVFSPDGRSIAFWSSDDQTLRRVAVGGGPTVTICRTDEPFGMSWGTAGIVFGRADTGIMNVSANGGTPEVLVRVKNTEQAYAPQMLPDGDTLLFTVASRIGDSAEQWDKAQILTHSLGSGERKLLVDGGSEARYVQSGHLVYARGGILFAVAMDVRRLELIGEAVPIVEGVRRATNITGVAHYSVSSAGSLIYVPGPVSTGALQGDLVLIDRKGAAEPLKLQPGPYQHPRVSPNGRQIAFGSDDGRDANVWIHDLGSAASLRRLTFGGRNRFPIWSADGGWVAFQSDREGDVAIFWQRADGSGAAERLTKPNQGASHLPQSWSPKSERFLFGVSNGSKVSLGLYSVQDRTATPVAGVESSNAINAAFSPDGEWVAYSISQGQVSEIYVEPFPATGAKYLISKSSTLHPVWSRDGREIVSQPRGGMWAAQTITTKPSFTFGAPVPLPRGGAIVTGPPGQRNHDVTADGRIVGVVPAGQGQTLVSTLSQIRVVLNWFEELKRLVPTK